MADLKKAKDIAMNEMFMNGGKHSDEYLNVSKQINNIIKEIKDPTSPKHVLDNTDITSSSLANYMILYINRSASQHCYLSNLRKGKCPKTPVAFKTSPKFDDSQNKAIQRAPEILKKPPMNILKESEFFTNFFLYFRPRLLSAPNPIIEYESLLFNIKRLLRAIMNNVKCEKDYLLNKNCKTVSFVYTNEYVILCTEVILSAIFFFIIFNPHISRGETLEEFFGDLNYVCDILSEKDKRTGLQNFLKKFTIDAKLPFDMDVRVEALTHNADLIYAHFATLNSIDDILVEELGQGTYTPFDNSIIKAFDKISTTNEIVDCIENIMKGKNLKKKNYKEAFGKCSVVFICRQSIII